MKTLFASALLILALVHGSFAGGPKIVVSKEVALAAIDAFRRDPTSEQAQTAMPLIVAFADGPDVNIKISMTELIWMSEKQDDKYGPLLLTAFIAGNIKSQLDNHVAKNDSLAGLTQVIETYKQLQKIAPTLRSPGIDKLVAWQAEGKLQDHIDK